MAVRVQQGAAAGREGEAAGGREVGDHRERGARRGGDGDGVAVAGQQARPVVDRHREAARLDEGDGAPAPGRAPPAGRRSSSPRRARAQGARPRAWSVRSSRRRRGHPHTGGLEQTHEGLADLGFLMLDEAVGHEHDLGSEHPRGRRGGCRGSRRPRHAGGPAAAQTEATLRGQDGHAARERPARDRRQRPLTRHPCAREQRTGGAGRAQRRYQRRDRRRQPREQPEVGDATREQRHALSPPHLGQPLGLERRPCRPRPDTRSCTPCRRDRCRGSRARPRLSARPPGARRRAGPAAGWPARGSRAPRRA